MAHLRPLLTWGLLLLGVAGSASAAVYCVVLIGAIPRAFQAGLYMSMGQYLAWCAQDMPYFILFVAGMALLLRWRIAQPLMFLGAVAAIVGPSCATLINLYRLWMLVTTPASSALSHSVMLADEIAFPVALLCMVSVRGTPSHARAFSIITKAEQGETTTADDALHADRTLGTAIRGCAWMGLVLSTLVLLQFIVQVVRARGVVISADASLLAAFQGFGLILQASHIVLFSACFQILRDEPRGRRLVKMWGAMLITAVVGGNLVVVRESSTQSVFHALQQIAFAATMMRLTTAG
jgi:hypothetical protein